MTLTRTPAYLFLEITVTSLIGLCLFQTITTDSLFLQDSPSLGKMVQKVTPCQGGVKGGRVCYLLVSVQGACCENCCPRWNVRVFGALPFSCSPPKASHLCLEEVSCRQGEQAPHNPHSVEAMIIWGNFLSFLAFVIIQQELHWHCVLTPACNTEFSTTSFMSSASFH